MPLIAIDTNNDKLDWLIFQPRWTAISWFSCNLAQPYELLMIHVVNGNDKRRATYEFENDLTGESCTSNFREVFN